MSWAIGLVAIYTAANVIVSKETTSQENESAQEQIRVRVSVGPIVREVNYQAIIECSNLFVNTDHAVANNIKQDQDCVNWTERLK